MSLEVQFISKTVRPCIDLMSFSDGGTLPQLLRSHHDGHRPVPGATNGFQKNVILNMQLSAKFSNMTMFTRIILRATLVHLRSHYARESGITSKAGSRRTLFALNLNYTT